MSATPRPAMYQGDGDHFMQEDVDDRIILVPDAYPSNQPSQERRIRIMWGQHLLDDLVHGHYRTLICAVNAQDNSHGIIAQVAAFSPSSQWDAQSITAYAAHLLRVRHKARVLKYDMDALEVLAVLRPVGQSLTLPALAAAMRVAVDMLQRRRERLPAAAVSFLEARMNHLVDDNGQEPCFETVLAAMFDAGYTGDVYPPPGLWHAAPTAVFARYPFPASLDERRRGGY